MTTNYGERPGLTIDADRERSIRAASIASGTAEERSIARTLLAELDAERAARQSEVAGLSSALAEARASHRETLAALELCADALERTAREQAPHLGALNPDLWSPAQNARAILAQARGSRDGVHCACGNVVGADGVRCVECAR